jgi:hypothetical protein
MPRYLRPFPGVVLVLLLLASFGSASAQQCGVLLEPSDGKDDDHFGDSISMSGPIALIGANRSDDLGPYSGSAYVYRFDGSRWIEEQKVTAAPGHSLFGFAVACDGDWLLIGAPNFLHGSGAAYLFQWNGSSWVEKQRLRPSDDRNRNFGETVALRGQVASVGAPSGDFVRGAAYVYELVGSQWVERQKLEPIEIRSARFGVSLAIDGDWLAVGDGDRSKHPTPGAAYLFRRNGSSWRLEQRFESDLGTGEDFFAQSLSLDGDVLAVGDPLEGYTSPGAVHVYRFDGAMWIEEQVLRNSEYSTWQFGRVVSVSGDAILVDSRPSPYIYRRKGSVWLEEQELHVPPRGGYNDSTVACLSGDQALIGNPYDESVPRPGNAQAFVVRDALASRLSYGQGWPGTRGIPALEAGGDPVLHALELLTLENSLGTPTVGVLLIGDRGASIPTVYEGTLLVVPRFALPIGIPVAGFRIITPLPCDGSSAGVSIFLQGMELDPGATQGVSFSRGLRLNLGF